jgi:hypothetical protein
MNQMKFGFQLDDEPQFATGQTVERAQMWTRAIWAPGHIAVSERNR